MNTKITKILFLVVAFVMAFAISAQAAVVDTIYYNATDYQNANKDLKKAYNGNETLLAQHWNAIGKAEGRSPSKYYVPDEYLELNTDLKKVFVSNGKVDYVGLYNHFVACGIKEGRAGSNAFNPQAYIDNNSDLKKAYTGADGKVNYEAAYTHYALIGEKEGRTAVAKHEHKTVKVEAKEATCEEDGNIEYYTCEGCDKLFSDAKATKEITSEDTVAPATGHKTVKVEAKEATCTEDGNIEYYTCEGCDKLFADAEATEEITVEDTVIEKVAHVLTHVEAVAATCTEEGNIEFWSCDNCDKLFADAEATEEITDVVEPKIAHSYEKTAIGATTCETEGKYFNVCSVCGETEMEEDGETVKVYTGTVDHDYSTLVKTVAPTCTANGYSLYTCSVCGKSTTNKNITDKVAHNMTKHDAVEPTCEVAGNVEYYSCATCGKNYEDEAGEKELAVIAIPATGHDWGDGEVTTEPTCTATGVKTYTCANDAAHKYTETVPATGHTWNEGEVTLEATCTTAGNLRKTCTVCEATDDVVIPAKGHDLEKVEAVAPTCTEDGNIEYYACKNCDKFFDDENETNELNAGDLVDPATGHNWGAGWVVTTPATETSCAIKTRTCTVCNEKETDALSGHTPAALVSAATCTKPAISLCATCNKKYESAPAAGHTWDAGVVTTPATCTTDGVKTYTCDVCDETKTEVIPATDHDWDAGVVTTPVTCTTDGVKTYTCQNDGSHKKTEVIPATGHTAVTKHDATDATCAVDGNIEYYTCDGCGAIFVKDEAGDVTIGIKNYTEKTLEDVTIPKTGHDWDTGEVTAPATCTVPGTLTKTCTICGDTEDFVIAAIGHKLTEVPAVEETCTTAGNIAHYKCDNCSKLFVADPEGTVTIDGAKYTEKTALQVNIDALGHNFTDATIISAANDKSKAKISFYCDRCNESIAEDNVVLTHVEATASVAEHYTAEKDGTTFYFDTDLKATTLAALAIE